MVGRQVLVLLIGVRVPTSEHMHFVYIIKSKTHATRYIGSTDNIPKRLQEHNNKKCRYTSGRIPWNLFYQEKYETRAEAMQREKFLKSGQGRKWLDEKLK